MSILSNVRIEGRWTMGSGIGTSYFDRIRAGTGTPGNANVAGGIYCNVLEVAAAVYLGGVVTTYAAAHNVIVASGTATGYSIGRGAGAPYFRLNTLSAQVEMWKRMEVHHSGGVYNAPAAGVSVTQTRQPDWFRYRLGQNSTVGGMLTVSSPYSGRACVILDAYVNRENNCSGCSHMDIGITSGAASNVGDLMNGVSLTATGVLRRDYTAVAGGSGNSGLMVTWAGTNKLVATASAGAAGGASNFSGALYVLCKLTD